MLHYGSQVRTSAIEGAQLHQDGAALTPDFGFQVLLVTLRGELQAMIKIEQDLLLVMHAARNALLDRREDLFR